MEKLFHLSPLKLGALLAAIEALYIIIVATFMTNVERIFGSTGPDAMGAILILMLLVFSAAVSGTVIFGIPVLLALKGRIHEGVHILGWTVAWFFLIFLVLAVILLKKI